MGLERDDGKDVDAERIASRGIEMPFLFFSLLFPLLAKCQCCLSRKLVML
jgi:hypothetical protein